MRLLRFTFVSLTSIVRSNSRFTRADLRRRKWDFMPLAERICPVAVKVNRRFADQCFQIPISWGHTGTANDPNVLGVDNPVLPDGELALDYGVVSYTRVFVAA